MSGSNRAEPPRTAPAVLNPTDVCSLYDSITRITAQCAILLSYHQDCRRYACFMVMSSEQNIMLNKGTLCSPEICISSFIYIHVSLPFAREQIATIHYVLETENVMSK